MREKSSALPRPRKHLRSVTGGWITWHGWKGYWGRGISVFPDIVEALVLTGLSLSKESCRARIHQKTEILASDLVHPSIEKMLLAPVSTTIASFLSAMLPHLLPLRPLFFNHRGSFICFQIIYPLNASVGTFSSLPTPGSSGQPAPKTEHSSALILTWK